MRNLDDGGHFGPLPEANNESIDGKNLRLGTVRLDALMATGNVQSSDYVAGTSGWIIRGDGTAEFADVTVRGNIIATSGQIAGDLQITGGGQITINSGTNEVMILDDNYLRIEYYNSTTSLLKGQFALYGIAGTGATPPLTQIEAVTSGEIWVVSPDLIKLSTPDEIQLAAPVTTATGYIEAADGSVTKPTYGFYNDINSGIYSPVDNTVGIAANGAISCRFVSGAVRAQSGSASAPSIGAASHTTTGLYWTTNTLGIAGGGAEAARFLSNNVYLTGAKDNTTASAANTLIQAADGRIYRSTSSLKYKSNWRPAPGMEAIRQLKPGTFHSNVDDRDFIGFGAEEVIEVLPAASVDGDENYDVRAIVATLTSAVIEMDERIKELETQ